MISLLPMPFLNNRDFLFHPIAQTNLTLFAHIIYHETTKILVKNTSNRPLPISRYQKLSHMVGIRYNNCFLTNIKSILNSAIFLLQNLLFFKHKSSCILIPTNQSIEMRLDNKIKVYEDKHTVILLA